VDVRLVRTLYFGAVPVATVSVEMSVSDSATIFVPVKD
jgi:hypothetical protein